MDLPLPKYRTPCDAANLIMVISMFAEKIDAAIKTLTAEANMQFAGKNHMVQLIMYTAGLFMSEENFKDIETYLGEGAEVLLRDFGGAR